LVIDYFEKGLKMKYSVNVTRDFSSAHALRDYHGKCEHLHGHNWKVELTITGSKLDKSGMLVDFVRAKMLLEETLMSLDHKYLNNIPQFRKTNPTAENIAAFIYASLKTEMKAFGRTGLKISKVKVWESEATWAEVEA
jgi:6-pyruvoyltetrahydropterin/6-carboxytetrahydropterin synthase